MQKNYWFENKRTIQQFYYLEEKINFNTDIIISFLLNNEKIYENFGTKIYDINIKLRELCEMKSKEYVYL